MPFTLPNESRGVKNLLFEQFLNMYKTKPIDTIKVLDLCQKCDISRGTFYYYFQDIYDLCEQLENTIIKNMENDLGPMIAITTLGRSRPKNDQRFINAYEACLKQYMDNRTLYRILLSGSHGGVFHNAWVQSVYRMLDTTFQYNNIQPEAAPLVRQFLAGGLVSLLAFWLLTDNNYSPKEIATAMDQLLFYGAFAEEN